MLVVDYRNVLSIYRQTLDKLVNLRTEGGGGETQDTMEELRRYLPRLDW